MPEDGEDKTSGRIRNNEEADVESNISKAYAAKVGNDDITISRNDVSCGSVFFNLFAAAEPSANVCATHETLCNVPSVYIATTAQNCGCEFFVPGNFGLFRRNPWQPLTEP